MASVVTSLTDPKAFLFFFFLGGGGVDIYIYICISIRSGPSCHCVGVARGSNQLRGEVVRGPRCLEPIGLEPIGH